ncbi:MAG: hypothetical protein SGPRY_009329 [Prymnesium sp.]
MNALLSRSSFRPLARSVRNMSGHSAEEAIAEMQKWKKISYAFMPTVALFAVYTAYDHMAHHDDTEKGNYPYMNKRDKPLPWTLAGGLDCGLFDYHCSNRIKAAKAAMSEGH